MRRITLGSPGAGLRIGAAAVAAVLVAEAAVWLLRPRGEPIEPDPVTASAYFEPEQVERAEDYRDGQRWLLLAEIAISAGVLLALALGRPRMARRGLEALARRPVLGAAAAGAAISLAVTLAQLPVSAIAHERSVDAGISTQGFGEWLWDSGRAAAISSALAAVGAALLIFLVRRLPRAWWPVAAAGVVAYAILFVVLAPILLAPIFNDFRRLEPGPARDEVLRLAERAGVEVGEVYSVDASRRSTTLNAYVSGLGPTKRVVVYDNLLAAVERPALRSVLAHELAHAENRDLWRGIAFIALVAPVGMLFVYLGGTALARRGGADPASPAALPAYALAIAVASLVLGIAGNQLSRDVEAEADAFALRLTDDPGGLIDLQTRLAERNLSDPDPPGWARFLFGTHPTTLERIGAAEAYREASE
jgi:Zn-dependent protease with chaperone function